MANRTLGPYELLEEVGYGGMATVYRANQPSVDRNVAIKVIMKRRLDDPEAIQRFQREARLIARLEHPHILPVYDFDGRHDPPYIVMRYLDRGTLADVMSQGILPQNEALFLLQQVGSALDYAHRQGIVHRDIKPSNIMMDREGNAFVTDFGIARMVSGGQAITMTGALIGTPSYMSPEQSQGHSDLDHRTDIYALGVILFQMLTGKLPFSDPNTFSVLMMHVNEPIPSAFLANSNLPPTIDDLFRRALAKRPDDRYQSASEMVEALALLMGGTMSTTPERLRSMVAESTLTQSRRRPTTDYGTGSRPPSEQNKTITALYVSTAEYAEIIDELDGSEAARNALIDFWTAVEPIINVRNGTVVSRAEDTILALWGAEMAREDDTEQAIRAALDIRTTLEQHFEEYAEEEDEDEPLPINIALNTGLVLLTPQGDTGDYSASGATISLTYRLMQQSDGAILITHSAYNQVRGVFDMESHTPLTVRKSRDPIPTYRVNRAKPRAFRRNTRGIEGIETKTIGREAELKTMQNAFLDAVEDEETQAITLVSDAGLGKSRLLYEFRNWVELRPYRSRLFQGRATPEMSARPYALLRDIISNRFEILDSDSAMSAVQKLQDGIAELTGESHEEMAHFIGHLAGFDQTESPYLKGLLDDPQQITDRARLMFQRLIIAICEDRPVFFELEDVHNADDASLDLLTDLMTENQDLPLITVIVTRPSLFDHRPTWGSGQSFHTRLELRPLDRRESRSLAREILQKVDRIPKNLRDLLVDRSEGNPFFMEELIKMLIDDRVIIKQSDDEWIIEEERISENSVPTTLIGLLQARLDGLLYPERLTLQRAAVIGRIFYDTALEQLDRKDNVQLDDLPTILRRLMDQEFIYERETTAFAGSTEYIFGKSMLQDVLLSTLLRRQQECYNEAAAEWVIEVSGSRISEYDGLIADYYEKAGRFEKAAHYLQTAGEKATAVSAFSEARGLFERALTLLPAESPARAILFLRLGEARYHLSDYPSANSSLNSALKLSRSLNETTLIADVLYWQSQTAVAEGKYEEALSSLEESVSLARENNHPETLARVLYGLGDLQWRQGQNEEAAVLLNECLTISRKNGYLSQELTAMNRLGALAIGGNRLADATEIYEEIVTKANEVGNREMEATALNNLGVVTYAQEDWEKTIFYHSQSLALSREMGQKQMTAMLANNLGDVSQRLNDLTAAKEYLSEGLQVARQIGATPLMLTSIQSAGTLITLEGDSDRGLALLGLSVSHPASNADHLRTLEDCFAFLNLEGESETVKEGLAHGRELDLDTVAEGLLTEWSPQ